MARGGSRAGAGRKRGAAEAKTREVANRAAKEGVTPLDYMLKILRDDTTDDQAKRWAAEKAAPFIHPRLNAVEHSGNDKKPIIQRIEMVIVDPKE